MITPSEDKNPTSMIPPSAIPIPVTGLVILDVAAPEEAAALAATLLPTSIDAVSGSALALGPEIRLLPMSGRFEALGTGSGMVKVETA